jgi:hypothetical protein
MHHSNIDMDFLLIIATTDTQSTGAGRDERGFAAFDGEADCSNVCIIFFWEYACGLWRLGFGFWFRV